MRVVIVDDHAVVREGLHAVLAASPGLGLEVVGEAGSGHEARQLLRGTRVDVVLLDYRLPDIPGDRLCAELLAARPGLKVVMLTSYLSEDIVQRCRSVGAAGFVTKAAGLDELREVLSQIRAGTDECVVRSTSATVHRLHAAAGARAGETDPRRKLTPQQTRVLELAAAGCTYAEIGRRLNLSISTVRFHVRGMKERVGARTRAELIAIAVREALIAPGADAGA